MADENRCPQCGAELAADAPQGLCPGCLLKRGLETQPLPPEGEPRRRPPTVRRPRPPNWPLFPDLEIIELVAAAGWAWSTRPGRKGSIGWLR